MNGAIQRGYKCPSRHEECFAFQSRKRLNKTVEYRYIDTTCHRGGLTLSVARR
jgi:hypothetical protein